ncbi:hypothetical protein M752DRAFT_93037 [Aspergillus phoenicis ATCC 13157]|uniref:Uncharacterized protein n=1 Tax=Aspergillus phoenicis ATCC 13157 TaxID=1353007 RepID=A0A370P676_ASPPH|nr:hypothetical protein M752DRAFT_93037 [Aspergillus phoenicis ATCC 13157]
MQRKPQERDNKGIKRGWSVAEKAKAKEWGKNSTERAGCDGKITQTGKVMSKPIERKSVVGPTGICNKALASLSTAEVHTSQECHMCRGINAWDASVKVADEIEGCYTIPQSGNDDKLRRSSELRRSSKMDCFGLRGKEVRKVGGQIVGGKL